MTKQTNRNKADELQKTADSSSCGPCTIWRGVYEAHGMAVREIDSFIRVWDEDHWICLENDQDQQPKGFYSVVRYVGELDESLRPHHWMGSKDYARTTFLVDFMQDG